MDKAKQLRQWRPKEGWVNPFTEELKIIPTKRGRTRVGEDKATYEAGADAILEALRKSGLIIETVRDVNIPIPFPKDSRGRLIFIPDGEIDGT